MPYEAFKYTRCAVIVHGKSEFCLVRYIYTNLHLPVKIISRNNGKNNIQISGLRELLNKKQFRSLKAFSDEYVVEYDNRNKKLKNFKLFIIMDTDDCDEATMEKYKSGDMFNGHILNDYIIPVYNIKNLEDVMIEAGIMVKRIPDKDKGKYYSKIFPINSKPLSINTIEQVTILCEMITGMRQTNMQEFLEYCLSQVSKE